MLQSKPSLPLHPTADGGASFLSSSQGGNNLPGTSSISRSAHTQVTGTIPPPGCNWRNEWFLFKLNSQIETKIFGDFFFLKKKRKFRENSSQRVTWSARYWTTPEAKISTNPPTHTHPRPPVRNQNKWKQEKWPTPVAVRVSIRPPSARHFHPHTSVHQVQGQVQGQTNWL